MGFFLLAASKAALASHASGFAQDFCRGQWTRVIVTGWKWRRLVGVRRRAC
ncbi:hypothetical protein [Tardiphaga sp.]|jgi:hypothetical protein|uniref:hypothetical protein n=1 Tax=Tardiphaga sp. TaxID=1926292 RepID=UPI0026336A1D|nr:hypothetical protein [Tardiphaga sp.]